MKLDLREEKRRDNTKGIKDVGKASTAELNRTVDTGSPAAPKAKQEIKDRKEKAKAKPKDTETKDAETQDTDTKDAKTQDTADQGDKKKSDKEKSDEEKKAEEFAEFQKNYKLYANEIKSELKKAKDKANNPRLFKKALLTTIKLAEMLFNKFGKGLSLDLEQESGVPVEVASKSIFDSMRRKIKGQEKVEDLEKSSSGLESVIGRMNDPETFSTVKGILAKKGIKSPADYDNLSGKEKDDLMAEIDAALIKEKAKTKKEDKPDKKSKDEKPKDEEPKDDETVEKEKDDESDVKEKKQKKTNAVREALEKVYSVKRSNKYASIRTLLNTMKEN